MAKLDIRACDLTNNNTKDHLILRTAAPDDEAGIARVCLLTADNGADASALYSRSDLPGLIWATPYLVKSPAHCFVVEHATQIVGFIVTTPNTHTFEAWRNEHWWPEAKRRLQSFKPTTECDTDALTIVNATQQSVPAYADDYPAHLHINLLPKAQGTGFGRRLISGALDRLRRDNVAGIHLGVSFKNTNAMGFYNALGFNEVARTNALILGMSL